MEGAAAVGLVGTVPGDFGWNDIGDFHTLGDLLQCDKSGNVVMDDEDPTAHKDKRVLTYDTERVVIVPRSDRLVAVVGVSDIVVVDTPDALMICGRERAQDVKKIVEQLMERGETDLI